MINVVPKSEGDIHGYCRNSHDLSNIKNKCISPGKIFVVNIASKII